MGWEPIAIIAAAALAGVVVILIAFGTSESKGKYKERADVAKRREVERARWEAAIRDRVARGESPLMARLRERRKQLRAIQATRPR